MPADTESADLLSVSFYMQKLAHSHFLQSATFREDQIDGRAFLVVPGIILQEQVLNYYFVPGDEIQHFFEAWNGVPLTNGAHPDTPNGSANLPDYDGVIGRFYNAEYDVSKKQLKGEFWFDLELLRKTENGRTIEANIRSGQVMEVSTGYWADSEFTDGVWNDREYWAIHRNLRPDHVAILLEQTGACSVGDGCGVPRTNCALCSNERELVFNSRKTKKRRSLSMFNFKKRQKAVTPVALNIEDAQTLDALRGLGLKVEQGEGEGVWLVSNEQEPQDPQDPPAQPAADPFVNELKGAFDQIGGVEGFMSMLTELQAVLDAAKHNAQLEENRKKAIVAEIKKNDACTLSEATLLKMEMGELEQVREALMGPFGNFSMIPPADDGGGGQPVKRRAIGLAGSLKKEAVNG